MSNGYKYTTDRRKVFVCGELNSDEYIVQEVFVDDYGNEFPAGEKFTVKSLLDEPAKTWKESKLEDLDKQLERKKQEVERTRKKLDGMQKESSARLHWLKGFSRNRDELDQLETLRMFLAGEINYLVIWDMDVPEIQSFTEALKSRDEFDRTSIKLLSLFGNSDGTLDWKINRYSDGSGGNTTAIPARNYGEAVQIAQDKYDQKAAEWREKGHEFLLTSLAKGQDHIPALKIPSDVKNAYRDRKRKKRQKKIRELEEELAAFKAEEEDEKEETESWQL